MVTPLAHRMLKQLLLPKDKRTIHDAGRMLDRMLDIHCFEISDIIEESNYLVEKGGFNGVRLIAEATSFLPAQKTWIEWQNPNGNRVGCLLEERGSHAQVNIATSVDGNIITLPEKFGLPLVETIKSGDFKIIVPDGQSIEKGYDLGSVAATLIGALAFINTPRIIGRKQHMPNQRLERKLLKHRQNIGMFPLHAWTEVILKITPPIDMSEKASTEAHLTGQKALHFCRAHLRIMYGKLVVVKGHWRGDASLGIKQKRYKVTQ